MKLILVTGPSNCGKTTTIRNVFYKLCGRKKQKASNVLFYNEEGIGYPLGKDFEAIIKYKTKTVAFYSMGDVKSCCVDALIKYAEADVLIMALNNHFKPFLTKDNMHVYQDFPKHVVIKSEKFYSPTWVEKIIDAIFKE